MRRALSSPRATCGLYRYGRSRTRVPRWEPGDDRPDGPGPRAVRCVALDGEVLGASRWRRCGDGRRPSPRPDPGMLHARRRGRRWTRRGPPPACAGGRSRVRGKASHRSVAGSLGPCSPRFSGLEVSASTARFRAAALAGAGRPGVGGSFFFFFGGSGLCAAARALPWPRPRPVRVAGTRRRTMAHPADARPPRIVAGSRAVARDRRGPRGPSPPPTRVQGPARRRRCPPRPQPVIRY
ncbi:hypothetical protein L7F22_028597 [Adiantum nelumboides]|nr:hypothetical protein [Adiantum nelumboides]